MKKILNKLLFVTKQFFKPILSNKWKRQFSFIDNNYFDDLISQIYHSELQLKQTNSSEIKASFLDLHLSIFRCKIYKRDDFDFEIVNFPSLDGDVPRRVSYVNISQLIRFAIVSSRVTYSNTRNKLLTTKLLKKVREKSRECHNHKPQPFPVTKRKRKQTKPNKSNKRTKRTKISSLFPKRGNRNAKRTEKHKNKIIQGKT